MDDVVPSGFWIGIVVLPSGLCMTVGVVPGAADEFAGEGAGVEVMMVAMAVVVPSELVEVTWCSVFPSGFGVEQMIIIALLQFISCLAFFKCSLVPRSLLPQLLASPTQKVSPTVNVPSCSTIVLSVI